MAKNRRFPKYSKIEVDKEIWPPKYWDASRVCLACKARWPNVHLFSDSPCCGVETEIDDKNAPDMRWPDAVNSYLHGRFNKLYESYNGGRTDQELVYEDEKVKEGFDFEKVKVA